MHMNGMEARGQECSFTRYPYTDNNNVHRDVRCISANICTNCKGVSPLHKIDMNVSISEYYLFR